MSDLTHTQRMARNRTRAMARHVANLNPKDLALDYGAKFLQIGKTMRMSAGGYTKAFNFMMRQPGTTLCSVVPAFDDVVVGVRQTCEFEKSKRTNNGEIQDFNQFCFVQTSFRRSRTEFVAGGCQVLSMTEHAAIRLFERWGDAASTPYEDILAIIGGAFSWFLLSRRRRTINLHKAGMTSFPVRVNGTPMVAVCIAGVDNYEHPFVLVRTFLHEDDLGEADLAFADALTTDPDKLDDSALLDLFKAADQKRWARPPTTEDFQAARKFKALAAAGAL